MSSGADTKLRYPVFPSVGCAVAVALSLLLTSCPVGVEKGGTGPRRVTETYSCPEEMAEIPSMQPGAKPFCMDRYEASVVEVGADGKERPHSPYQGVEGLTVRATSKKGVYPQGYISQIQSAAACANAGKRLCSGEEFETACSGGDPKTNFYPYGGQVRVPGNCNEGKGSAMVRYFGADPGHWTYAGFNDPRLNQMAGGLAPTGSYEKCVSPYGIHDCVGNLHEWGSDPVDERGTGRFRGGFYGDAENNGHGCQYVTHAHGPGYHDYSTGFRCCADAKVTVREIP
jgi:formylglycine-generating enzyme